MIYQTELKNSINLDLKTINPGLLKIRPYFITIKKSYI